MSTAPDDFIMAITPDVMKFLDQRMFFAHLDDLMSPTNERQLPEKCGGSYLLAERLLREDGCSDDDVSDVLQVLHAKGGHCDCQILYNVSEDNRLKAAYWQAKTKGR